jgi:hypothetical protein
VVLQTKNLPTVEGHAWEHRVLGYSERKIGVASYEIMYNRHGIHVFRAERINKILYCTELYNIVRDKKQSFMIEFPYLLDTLGRSVIR